MHYEASLVQEFEQILRNFGEGASAFISDGGVKHRAADDRPGFKTTLRYARFIRDGSCSFGSEVDAKVLDAAEGLREQVSSKAIGKRPLLDLLIAAQGLNLNVAEFEFVAEEVLSRLRSLDAEPIAHSDAVDEAEDIPHALFYLHVKEVAKRSEASRDSKAWKTASSLATVRSASLVTKHLAYSLCGETSIFDTGQLCMSLSASGRDLPIRVFDKAMSVSAESLTFSPSQELAPYHLRGRDTTVRPLIEEAAAALLDAATERMESLSSVPSWHDAVLEALYGIIESFRSRYAEQEHGKGWTRDYRTSDIQGWSSLAVAEVASKAQRYLRIAVLLGLRQKYKFHLEMKPASERKLGDFKNLPFDVFKTISSKFVEREQNNPWSSAVLFGPPGTGKTSLATALAVEIDWKYVYITPSDLAQDGPSQIVARARELLSSLSVCEGIVILLDEFDAFIQSRESEAGHWQVMITNSLLPLLQELRKSKRNIFFVATNLVSELDDAALRVGRFDAILPWWTPNAEGRAGFLKKVYSDRSSDDVVRAVERTRWATFGDLQSEDIFESSYEPPLKRDDDKWLRQLKYARPKISPADEQFE